MRNPYDDPDQQQRAMANAFGLDAPSTVEREPVTTMPVGAGPQRETASNSYAGGRTSTSVFDDFQRANTGKSDEDILRAAYQQFTGRDADQGGLAAHLKNPGGVWGGVRAIYDSPESATYGRSHVAEWGAQPPQVTTPATAGPQTFNGFTPKYAMEGFNFNREQNTGKSAKDAFAYLANQAPPPPLNDKAALGQWFNTYIAPGMNALGHAVSNVQGDKFHLKNWQGDFDVDYGRGAGADGGALAWQVDDNSAVMPSGAAYVPPARPINETNASSLDRILAEIAALQNGGSSPIEQDAMARMFAR